jgi:hypothetical protein
MHSTSISGGARTGVLGHDNIWFWPPHDRHPRTQRWDRIITIPVFPVLTLQTGEQS